jgi:hypothetical protein
MSQQAEVTVQREFEASADALFAVLGDFTNLSWVPAIAKVEFVGEGPGMIRYMYIEEGGPATVEVLEELDVEQRRIGYSIPENNPLPVEDYRAWMHVVDLGDGRSRLDWHAKFGCGDLSVEEAIATIETFYNYLLPDIAAVVEVGQP